MGALMLWMPMLAAAWAAAQGSKVMDCCKGGMCPMGMMHSKMKMGHNSSNKATAEEMPMECQHHGKMGMCNCAMSCRSENSRVLMTSVIFVLPEPTDVSHLLGARMLSAALESTETEQPFEPPYPPPRTSPLSL